MIVGEGGGEITLWRVMTSGLPSRTLKPHQPQIAAGVAIAAISVILGVRHRRWRYTHSFGVVLGIAAAAAARLKDKYVKAPESE